MHCKECGYPFAKGEEVCSQCGTPRESLEIDWNLSNYPEPGKVEDLDFDWKTGEFTEHKEQGGSIEGKVEEISKEPKTSQILREPQMPEILPRPEDLGIPFITREEREAREQLEEEEVKEQKAEGAEEVEALQEPLDSLNKFFKFDKASDEFQRLLEAQQNRVEEFELAAGLQSLGPLEPKVSEVPEILEGIPFIEDLELEEEEVLKEEEPEVIWLSQRKSVPDILPISSIPLVEEKEAVLNEIEPVAEAEPLVEKEPLIEEEPLVEEEPSIEEEALVEEEPLWWMESENDEEEEASRAFKAGDVVLGILTVGLIIIGLFIGSIIGIQHFKPESPAAEKAGLIQESIVTTLSQVKHKIESLFLIKDPEEFVDESEDQGNESAAGHGEEEGRQEEEQRPDPIDAVVLLNTNIKIIKTNNNLGLEKGKDYGKKSITESLPVQDGQEKVLERIIEFNSKWIDYVNDNNKDVIALTKKGSQARKNVETFTKVGKVKQDFLLLEIGEIRKTKNEYFIWVYEEILENKDGKTQTNTYNYVYSLENINGNMLITNYHKY